MNFILQKDLNKQLGLNIIHVIITSVIGISLFAFKADRANAIDEAVSKAEVRMREHCASRILLDSYIAGHDRYADATIQKFAEEIKSLKEGSIRMNDILVQLLKESRR